MEQKLDARTNSHRVMELRRSDAEAPLPGFSSPIPPAAEWRVWIKASRVEGGLRSELDALRHLGTQGLFTDEVRSIGCNVHDRFEKWVGIRDLLKGYSYAEHFTKRASTALFFRWRNLKEGSGSSFLIPCHPRAALTPSSPLSPFRLKRLKAMIEYEERCTTLGFQQRVWWT